MKQYVVNIFVWLDQGVNVALAGDPDETLSSRAAKNQHKWYWAALGAVLESIHPGHLEWAIERDEGKHAAYKNKEQKDENY